MIGEITKILPAELSANGNVYIRVMFKMEDGSWAKTDICPDYRNYPRWKKVLRVGNRLFNLILREPGCVNADSFPRLLEGKQVNKAPDLSSPEQFSKYILC